MIYAAIIIGVSILSAGLFWCCCKVGADSDFKEDNKKWNSKD